MSVVAYNQPTNMTPYHQAGLPQQVDPLAHLYNLEREMENAERRTASIIEDLVKRLDKLEQKVVSVDSGFSAVSRQLEQKVVSLAQRVNAMADRA